MTLNTGFNPVVGFLPVTTRTRAARRRRSRSFQSRCGFSPRRDSVGSTPATTGTVSIPLWVFSPSRPTRSARRASRATSFNPVVGFLPVATVRTAGLTESVVSFQSRCGFSPRRDRGPISPQTTYSLPSIGESDTRLRHPPLYTDFIKGHVDHPATRPVPTPSRRARDHAPSIPRADPESPSNQITSTRGRQSRGGRPRRPRPPGTPPRQSSAGRRDQSGQTRSK